jgi:uncharacterized cupin superfamily protein
VPGWFVVNVSEAPAVENEKSGLIVDFEGDDEFPEVGINIHVLEPGQPNGRYHGEERRLRAWDFVHCPPWTEHIFVGAGDGPCAILMVGGRSTENRIRYAPNEAAAKYDASVKEETDSPREAYADWKREFKKTRATWPLTSPPQDR